MALGPFSGGIDAGDAGFYTPGVTSIPGTGAAADTAPRMRIPPGAKIVMPSGTPIALRIRERLMCPGMLLRVSPPAASGARQPTCP
jgi:hypothetical protein